MDLPKPPAVAATSVDATPLPPVPPTDADDVLLSPAGSLAKSASTESLEDSDGFVDVVAPTKPTSTAASSASTSTPATPATVTARAPRPRAAQRAATKPFQRLQFLVRDWQNFDIDWDEDAPSDQPEKQQAVYNQLRTDMDTYLFNVIKDRGMSDLQTTREQIVRCFDSVDCFLLPHPGFSVTKKTFDGAINKIENAFR